MLKINNFLARKINPLKPWVEKHYLQIGLFNIGVIMLLLLKSAGYFEPYFQITINFIVFFCLTVSIFLLDLKSKGFFIITLFFLIFGAFLRVLSVNNWAERTIFYGFQSLIFGVVMIIWENNSD